MNINNLPKPKFEVFVDGFRVTLFKSPQKTAHITIQKTTQITPRKTRVETRDAMLRLIKGNPSITRKELPNFLNLTVKGIDWNIKQLKNTGILRRIGPDKGGHWGGC